MPHPLLVCELDKPTSSNDLSHHHWGVAHPRPTHPYQNTPIGFDHLLDRSLFRRMGQCDANVSRCDRHASQANVNQAKALHLHFDRIQKIASNDRTALLN